MIWFCKQIANANKTGPKQNSFKGQSNKAPGKSDELNKSESSSERSLSTGDKDFNSIKVSPINSIDSLKSKDSDTLSKITLTGSRPLRSPKSPPRDRLSQTFGDSASVKFRSIDEKEPKSDEKKTIESKESENLSIEIPETQNQNQTETQIFKSLQN